MPSPLEPAAASRVPGRLRLAARAFVSVAVLAAGWAAADACLQGWRALAPADPAPARRARPAGTGDPWAAADAAGGSWRFGGFPWALQLSEGTRGQTDVARLAEGLAAEAGQSEEGVPLGDDQADALARLGWLGARETPLARGRVVWELESRPLRVALALRREVGRPTRLLGGFVAREDPSAGGWATYSLVPSGGAARPAESLLPASASATPIASRFDARGDTVLEIAEVTDRAFFGLPVDADEPVGGFRKFGERTVAGRRVTYYRGPCVRGRPVLVVAAAAGG